MDAISRIEAASLARIAPTVRQAIADSPDPERAAIHLERWLAATASPATFVSLLNEGHPEWLIKLLACSSQVTDILVQNPEMGAIFFEDFPIPTLESLLQEGRRMLEVAHSTQHRLDRLRLLKQKWTLRLAYVEVNGLWNPSASLQAISDLAEAIVLLAVEATWPPFAMEKGLEPKCPIQIVAFGKLGGHELNYSSDIDLAYIVSGDLTDTTALERYCTHLGRALENQMGRGMLYRVDLRLRPYGASGPILNRMSAVEAYYDRYAEVWEHLALVRSRAITPGSWWNNLRSRVAFGSHRSSWQIEELLKQRERLEEITVGDDLKRGPGGIRDIEFLTQTLQLVHAGRKPELEERRTLAVLPLLSAAGLLAEEDAKFLSDAYCFLRLTEHRLQLEANVQTHTLPEDPMSLGRLALSLGFQGPNEFLIHLNQVRIRVRDIYLTLMRPLASSAVEAAPGLDWLGDYASATIESEGGLARVQKLASNAPVLIEDFQGEPALIEQLISGEILEGSEFRIDPSVNIAKSARVARTKRIARWALTHEGSLGDSLDEVTDALLHHLLGALPLDCVALGSYATHDTGLTSDADLVLFCPSGVRHLDAEQAAHGFLQQVQTLRNQGYPLSIDLRLRPDGKKGMLARTYDGFLAYAQTDMEPWERLACGRSRLISGSARAIETLHEISSGLDPIALENLLSVKQRLETELAGPDDLKHGLGGFDDLNWLIQLLTLSRPLARNLTSVTTPQRLNDLRKAGLLTEAELETLVTAHRNLLTTRWLLECGDQSLAADGALDHRKPYRVAIREVFERKVAELRSR